MPFCAPPNPFQHRLRVICFGSNDATRIPSSANTRHASSARALRFIRLQLPFFYVKAKIVVLKI